MATILLQLRRRRARSLVSLRTPSADSRRSITLDRKLARNYERCKDDNRGRFKSSKRLDGYCAAVA